MLILKSINKKLYLLIEFNFIVMKRKENRSVEIRRSHDKIVWKREILKKVIKNLHLKLCVIFLILNSLVFSQKKIPIYISKPNKDFTIHDSIDRLSKFQFGLNPFFFQLRNMYSEKNYTNYYSLTLNLKKLSFNAQFSYQFNRKLYLDNQLNRHFKNDVFNYEFEVDYLLFNYDNRQRKIYYLVPTSDSLLIVNNRFIIKPTKVYNNFHLSLGFNHLNYFLPIQISSNLSSSEKIYFYQSKQVYGRLGIKYRHFLNSFILSKNSKSYKQKSWLFSFDLLLLLRDNPYLLHVPSGDSDYFRTDDKTTTSRLGSKVTIAYQQQIHNSRIGLNFALNYYILPKRTFTAYTYSSSSSINGDTAYESAYTGLQGLRFWNLSMGITLNEKKWKK